MYELQRLRAEHDDAILEFELANRSYFARSISDRGDDYFSNFVREQRILLDEQATGRVRIPRPDRRRLDGRAVASISTTSTTEPRTSVTGSPSESPDVAWPRRRYENSVDSPSMTIRSAPSAARSAVTTSPHDVYWRKLASAKTVPPKSVVAKARGTRSPWRTTRVKTYALAGGCFTPMTLPSVSRTFATSSPAATSRGSCSTTAPAAWSAVSVASMSSTS